MIPYPILYQLLLQHRRPSDALWDALSEAVRQLAYMNRDIWVDLDEVPTSICLIKSGAALGYRYFGGTRKLTRVWTEGALILLAENRLIGEGSDLQVTFPVPTTVLELKNESLVRLRRDYVMALYEPPFP